MVSGEMTPLLLVLWREKHADGKEQFCLRLNLESCDKREQSAIPVFAGAVTSRDAMRGRRSRQQKVCFDR